MRKLLQTIILLLFTSFCLNAQITVNSGLTPNNYVNNLVGAGISFSNIQYFGDPQSIGQFSGANAGLGFTNGIILSSDPAVSADPTNTTFPFLTSGLTEADLPELIPFISQLCPSINDGLILQFDFVPQSTPVSFSYVFASIEYPEYVCSQFNDAFAFLISGPGIVGEQNLALVPGTSDPITISTINDGNVGTNGSSTNIPCITNNSQYFNIGANLNINFDGFTDVLTAVADVIPCQTYTIRLMIGDGCDTGLGSAVFLQANSFGSTPVSINTLTLNNDSTTYEGCAPASIIVTKNDPSLLNSDVSVDLTIQGTATNGVDYTGLPATVTIPAGSLTANLSLSAIQDGIAESTESVIISYPVGCGLFDTLVLFIRNKPLLVVTPDPAPSLCGGQGPVTISAAVTGGVAPISYSWSNSLGTALSASVNPFATTTYTLTATDYCGTISNGTVTVPVGTTPAIPIIQQPVGPYCENETISITASTTTPSASLVWSGPNSFLYTGTTVSIPNSTVVNSGNYSVFASLNGCDSQPANINVLVKPRPTPPQLGSNSPACEGTTLSLTAITTPASAVITWNGPNGSFTATGASQSIAAVTSSANGPWQATASLNGCDATAAGFTQVVINDTPDAPNATSNSPVCSGFDLNLSSTSIGDSYLWTGPGAWTANTQNATRTAINNTQGGTYAFSVTINNCTSPPTPVNVLVVDASFLPTIGSNAPICENNTLTLNTPLVNNAIYHWEGPNGFLSSLQNNVINNATEVNEGDYSLYLVIGSCTTATNTFTGIINPKPVANAGLDVQVCSENDVTIGEAAQPNYSYSWSPIEGLNATNVSNPTFNQINLSGLVIPRQYILTVTSSGCQDNDTVKVELNPQPLASFDTPQPQCYKGNSFNFKAEGEYSDLARFVWSFGSQAMPDSSAAAEPQGVTFNTTGQQLVRLVVIDRGCYSNTYVVPVNVLKMPVANFGANKVETCEPSLIAFDNISENENGILNYSWNFGNGKGSNLESPSILYNNSGVFDVSLTVTDLNNCSDTYEIKDMITVNPSPSSSFVALPLQTTITNPMVIIEDLSNNATECMYLIGNIDTIFSFDKDYVFADTGTYNITQVLKNQFGCMDSSTQTVRIDLGYKVYIPTAFSPNNDGINDRFRIYGEDIYECEIMIFNRWGQLLYTSYDIENGWDGTIRTNDNPVVGGTYVYSISLKDRLGNKFDYDGTVTLLK
jgi:gliding motility-associated-like protein